MEKYLKETIAYVSKRNNYLVDKLNEINKTYWELYGDVNQSIGNSNEENA